MTSQYQYPYDPDGTNPDNVVTDNPHPLTPVQGSGYSLIVPKAGPFFRRDFELVHKTSNRILKPDVDYVFTHFVLDISHALQEHVYGSVTIVNQKIMGDVVPTYRTIGGELVLEEDEFAKYAIHILESDGAYPWDKLKDVPDALPPSEHEVPIETTAGYDELIATIEKISFGSDHQHDISNVRHLDDRLNNKLDANGNFKVLTDSNIHITDVFIGSIQCRLPKVKSKCLVKAKVQIVDGDGVGVLEVSGIISPYNDGAIPTPWEGIRVTPSYNCWDGDFYVTYDSEHYPVIILGNDKEWVNAHVSVVEYFTVDADQIYGEWNPFRVSINRSYDGISYINTGDKGYVLTPQDTEGELSTVINHRYFGVMPEGIYHGFEIVQSAHNQIRVGVPDIRNAAVIYDDDEAATVILNKDAQILTIGTNQHSAIVLELVPVGQVGDPRFKVDLPDREAQIRLVDPRQVLDGMIVIGEVNWPISDPVLKVEHLSYNNRQNASWNAGTFQPLDSIVPYEPQ